MRLPPSLEAHRARPFVGRAALTTDLVARIEAAASHALFVDGVAGSGKTALVAEVLARAESSLGRVLYGVCDQGYGRPYEALLRALRSDPVAFAQLLELRVDGLGLVVPELSAPSEAFDVASAEERQLLAANAMVHAFRALTARERLVVVLDDLQWAAPATVALIRHIVRNNADGRVTLVGTVRSTEVARNAPLADLLADLRVEAGVVRVRAEPLTVDDVALLTTALLTTPPADNGALHAADHAELAAEVWTRSSGNALFAADLLRFHREAATTALPDSIAVVVEHRITSLPPATLAVLEAVAVAGSVADVPLVTDVCAIDEDAAADALDELVDRGWLREEGGGFRCVHDVTREALIERMTSARRLRLHRRVGAHLRVRGGSALPAAAWHLRRAAPLGTAEDAVAAATEFARTAGDTPEEAEAVLADVLDVLDDVSLACRSDALLAMARVKQWLSDLQPAYDFALAAAESALDADDRPRIAAAVTQACHGQLACFDTRVPAMVERVAPLIDDPIASARLRSGHAFYEVWAADRGIDALPIAEAALDLARKVDDRVALTESLYAVGLGLQGSTRVADRRRVGEELLELAGEGGNDDDEVRFHALRLIAPAALELGDRAAFDRARGLLRAVVDRSGSWLHRGYSDLFAAGSAFLDGDLAAAEAHAAHALVDARGANFLDLFAGAVFVIRRQQGRLAELGLLGSSPPTSLQPMAWIAARAVAAIDLGEPAIAANALDELKAMALPTNLIRPSVVAAMAEAAWFLGDRDASSRVRDDLEARSGTLITIPGAAAALGAADRFIAMLHLLDGDSEAAAAAFDRAERLERNVGAHHLAADTQRCRQAIVS